MSAKALTAAIAAVLEVIDHGDGKHGVNSWERHDQIAIEKAIVDHVNGAQRHINRHRAGEIYDKDSNVMALAHATTRLLIALELQIRLERMR